MSSQIKPCGHRLVVKPFKQEEVDEVLRKHAAFVSTLTIINENKKREDASVDRGVVLAIGATAWKNDSFGFEPWCKVGDEILFAKFSGKFIDDPETGDTVVILNDEDVVAVVKEAQ